MPDERTLNRAPFALYFPVKCSTVYSWEGQGGHNRRSQKQLVLLSPYSRSRGGWMLSLSSLSPPSVQDKAQPTFRIGLPTSINFNMKTPQSHVRQSVSVVTTNLIRLTSKINCHSKINCSGHGLRVETTEYSRNITEEKVRRIQVSTAGATIFQVWHSYHTSELPAPVTILARSK